ncbi:hypothetical protein BpHYR1_013732 [Brachionus plicatilis]|uniref:Uncharacterized protein n=1 Tax=Brachionus plicatilis TaxID=10195 RepID=A0A3M7PAC1_BRAPC|nr:hypothetical protein BpHYR1_013732 [Brachionus plicatilis]
MKKKGKLTKTIHKIRHRKIKIKRPINDVIRYIKVRGMILISNKRSFSPSIIDRRNIFHGFMIKVIYGVQYIIHSEILILKEKKNQISLYLLFDD